MRGSTVCTLETNIIPEKSKRIKLGEGARGGGARGRGRGGGEEVPTECLVGYHEETA
jgi:hypothetical protein